MKQFNRLIVWVVVIGIGLVTVFSFAVFYGGGTEANKGYVIEANRIANQMNNGVLLNDIEIDQANYIQDFDWMSGNAEPKQIEQFFNGADVRNGAGFMIKPIYDRQQLAGYLRIIYPVQNSNMSLIMTVDSILLIALTAVLLMLLYVRRQIIKPFHAIEKMPLELSKGHLHQGIKESKSRFFGKFIWGLDLLREKLESQKQTNLRLEKDRQTLIASISHELKTPVSAIKLYAVALYEDLYESDKKRKECAKLIERNAEKIEKLIGEIITTSTSSLSDFEIQTREFYLSEWIEKVTYSNKEKLALLKINFEIEPARDKLLVGDPDRLVEVFDNIIENAIKYGDGNYIKVSFYEEDYRQLIRIENSGASISQNELPHMFLSFWRGSNVGDKPGNGLGLYIGKQLLKKMEGDIFAETKDNVVAIVLVVRL
ncbi:HAMP domain-containing sensor histidine kinase [Sporosarcina sp. E16_8]|uniref:sensor histidine kinase n=1 Tax=Sporosarcina sp. E16_8 TaxID=2789295 RepID=UPI001A935A58|nr:HAMP domain-containing sensor histidine kinase [Sporosarcina sp. E16_8]MBO0586944.1 HAMP domain-containing histidine kinase [Sporosarcina sp. E16_8]